MMSIRTVAAFGLLALTVACAVNPATGRREFMLVSEREEIAMGQEADPQITAAYGLVDDAALQSYVARIGMDMARISERPDLPWSFKVVDEPVVNAFALPGGFIYVTRGILAHFDSEAELAGVLGHEIGHVTARHSASQMSRQQLQSIGVGVGMVFSETFRDYGGIAVAGLQIMNLSYSRDDELQSDRLGLRYMSRNGYHPDEMIGVFEMLARASGASGGGRVPEWQLTHPFPENRQQQMRDEIAATGVAREGRIGRDDYLDRIDGMIWGNNPRHGYFEGQRFLHPDLAFELTFPGGWRTVNQTQRVAAVSPENDAIVTLEVASGAESPEAAMTEFLRQQGVSGGPPSTGSVSGVLIVRAPFTVSTNDGQLRGEVAFLEHGDLVYRMLGYAVSTRWSAYSATVRASISSFAPVTDPAVLSVQPLRLSIVRLREATSLQRWVDQNPQPVDMEVLVRINRVEPAEVLSSGRRIKTVVGVPVGS